MTELPDDELDKLFKKSSEELDPPYDPDDWNKLKRRLDEQDGTAGGAWLKKWWPLGLLLLLIFTGVAVYLGKDKKDAKSYVALRRENELKRSAASAKPALPVTSEGEAKDSRGLNRSSPDNDQTKTKSETRNFETGKTDAKNSAISKREGSRAIASVEKTASKPFPKSESKAADTNSRPLLPRSRSKAGGVYLEPNRSKGEGGDGALILPANEQAISTSAGSGLKGAEKVFAQEEHVAERTFVSAAMLQNRPLSWNNAGVMPKIDFEKPDIEPEPLPQKEEVQQAKWAVRFGYSPDLSTVGLKNFTKPGAAVALLAELSVSPRLFVQTGAVWSRKDYFAEAGSYILNPKWGYYTKPESVDGICKVLEIPLNLRYDIISGQKSRFFIGSGASSYYMLNEKYKYNYKNPDDPHIKYPSWKGSTGWYFLSHLNASVGYEYRLSNKLSLMGEPYARIPLKRVGYGKVNLVTMGFWLSLRYTPAFR
ncbi:porin family protein [Dyadobacter aurulentus]|uniref:PorT family protein n=1 Tax=Dyadobacter sp. UC 10 TaxID=2605428 RepID=UPI0011F32B13|nr:PorT family protein [Dyadobacter sp. UC 10]KAA0990832.1 PorT family protein [Dyadobacter sp. UC 10]